MALACLVASCGARESAPSAGSTDEADASDAGARTLGSVALPDVVDDRPSGPICPPGELFCLDPTRSALCDLDGLGFGAEAACSDGAQCSVVSGKCTSASCTPGERLCVSHHTWVGCHESGTGWDDEPVPCEGQQVCHKGACVDCVPGATGCEGVERRRTCAADATWEEAVQCGVNTRCDDQVGVCIPTTCDPETVTCAGPTTTATCVSNGAKWSYQNEPCAPGLVCHEGACLVCVPGALACDGALTSVACVEDGSGYEVATSCPSDTWCAPTTGTCEPKACEPGEIQCKTTYNYVSCLPDSFQWSAAWSTCEAGLHCVADACASCPLGVAFCEDDGTRMACTADGYVEEPCAAPLHCDLPWGGCAIGDVLCAATFLDCVSDTELDTCADDGQSWLGAVQSCPPGTECSFGSCVDPDCFLPVLLVVDRSGSMASKWMEVLTSLLGLVDGNRLFRYGLTFFPASVSAPPAPIGKLQSFADLLQVMSASPGGGTPLLAAFEAIAADPGAHFHGEPGAVIVLTDGEPSDCFGPSCAHTIQLAVAALADVGVVTYAVGFKYAGGTTGSLDALASGTPFGAFQADDTGALLEALTTIANELQLCPGP